MTEIDDALFVEAEIKEHHAALIRQMVAVTIIILWSQLQNYLERLMPLMTPLKSRQCIYNPSDGFQGDILKNSTLL